MVLLDDHFPSSCEHKCCQTTGAIAGDKKVYLLPMVMNKIYVFPRVPLHLLYVDINSTSLCFTSEKENDSEETSHYRVLEYSVRALKSPVVNSISPSSKT